MEFTRHRALWLCLLAALALTPAASTAGDEVLRIAVVAPQKGELSAYGQPIIAAVESVVGEFNAAAGPSDRRVELIVEDDGCRPETSVAVASEILALRPVGVIGHVCNEATRKALETYAASRLVVISPSADETGLTREGICPRFFRTVLPADAEAHKVADFVLNRLGLRQVAVWHTEDAYHIRQAEWTRRRIEAAMGAEGIAAHGRLPAGPEALRPLTGKAADGTAGLVLWADWQTTAALLERLRNLDNHATVIVAGLGRRQPLDQIGRLPAAPVYFCMPRPLLEIPAAAAARRSYIDAGGGEPTLFYYHAHAAATVLLQAVAGDNAAIDADAIAERLRRRAFDTVLGTIRFDEDGDVVGDFHRIVTPEDNGLKTVY